MQSSSARQQSPLATAGWSGLCLLLGLGACARTDVVTLDGASVSDAGSGGADAASADGIDGSGAACSLGQSQAALTVIDRSLVGTPGNYAGDPTLRLREGTLDRSQRLRREVAWQVALRVLAPAPLPDGALPLATPSLPTWQTWHDKDDLTRIFRRLYPELSPAAQAARAPFSDAALSAAWEWNDGSIADFAEWTAERRSAYAAAVSDGAALAGLAGIYRVAYSPAASLHLLQSYGNVLGCSESGSSESALPSKPDALRSTHCGLAVTPAPACLDGVFSGDAALIKADWRRADAGIPLGVYDTSATALRRRLSPDGPLSWDEPDAEANPGDDEIYTLRLPNGNVFRLAALHIMTKELDHWVWTTLWWSNDPDIDFGADRPLGVSAPFGHYKLCTAVAFEEQDPDPSGGFAEDLPSLGDALTAAYSAVGGPSWCSNPYIENGAGNAATNCIGCHQHAGTGLRTEDILSDAAHFPEHSRRRVRDDFRSDYVFAVSVGDDLGAMYRETEDHYAAP